MLLAKKAGHEIRIGEPGFNAGVSTRTFGRLDQMKRWPIMRFLPGVNREWTLNGMALDFTHLLPLTLLFTGDAPLEHGFVQATQVD